MYKYHQVSGTEGVYNLPGNFQIEVGNCMSISKALDKLGLYGRSSTPAAGQAAKGTRAHKHISSGAKTGSDLYYDAVRAQYYNHTFYGQEIFVWGVLRINPPFYLVGVFDALLTDGNEKILVEWKTTGQDNVSRQTLERALAQVCLYNYLLMESYSIQTTKVSVVPLHEVNDLSVIEMSSHHANLVARDLISDLLEGRKYGGVELKKTVELVYSS